MKHDESFEEDDSKYTLNLIHEVSRDYYFGSQSAVKTLERIYQKIIAHNDRVLIVKREDRD